MRKLRQISLIIYLLSGKASRYRGMTRRRRARFRSKGILLSRRRRRQYLHHVDLPENPILRDRTMRDIVGHRIPPRGQAPIGPQEVAVPGLELNGAVFPDRLPLDGAVEAVGKRLQHFPAGHSEEKRLIRRRQVLAVAALEADNGVGVFDGFDGPFSGFGGSVSVLGHGFFVFLGDQVFVVGALQADGFGVMEQVHCWCSGD